MKTSSFSKVAGYTISMRSITLLAGLMLSISAGVVTALAATDAPPSINFSFGDAPSEAPPSLSVPKPTPTQTPTQTPTPKPTPTQTPTPTPTPTPKPEPVIESTPIKDYYLPDSSIEKPELPVASKKPMAKTGPEMLFAIIPAIMGSTGYRLYRRKRNASQKNLQK